jgi:pyruvate dehydrogenase E2 component (dihydrolipoamide acetyltransferase)
LAVKQPDDVATPSERIKISPAARVKARTLRINLESITGSGPGGVITLEDIEKHRPAGRAAQGDGMREVIARAMSRSKREIPHYYLSVTCSFLAARTWLDQYNAGIGVEGRVLPAALFVKAVASAARAMPDFNGFYRDDKLSVAADVNVGMAIAMRGGRLVAPAILAADTKDLTTIMRELRDLTIRVRAGHMRGSELSLPTITVTSLGEEAIDSVIPVIYPPQVAIVGFGSVVERPWIIDGVIKPAPIVHIDLAADHRATDGRAGAQFLAHIRDALQTPERL